MRTTVIIGLMGIMACTGCAHTYVAHPDSPRFTRLQQKATNENVDVTLTDRQFYQDVMLTRLAQDSTSWRLSDGTVVTAPTEALYAIRLENTKSGRAAVEGLGFGFLVGALVGAGIGLVSGDDNPEESLILSFTAEEKAALAGIIVGAMGGVTGLLIGAALGSPETYRIAPPSPPTSSPPTARPREER
jgi:hypothetical protein